VVVVVVAMVVVVVVVVVIIVFPVVPFGTQGFVKHLHRTNSLAMLHNLFL
jgi:hypothetical protein